MEITTPILGDMESFVFPKEKHPDGEYSLEITRTENNSSVDFIFDSEECAQYLARKMHYPDNEQTLYNGDPNIYNSWKHLNRLLSAPAKLLGPTPMNDNDSHFRLRIVANYTSTDEFRDDTVQLLVKLKLVPEASLALLT